jgi:hypothetical protein
MNERELRRLIAKEARKALTEGKNKYSLRFLLEDADPGKIDPKLYPNRLSSVDKDLS